MRKVNLRMNEIYKYETIKKLIETNGNKNNDACKLNCTTRTINRLIQRYHTLGKAGFIHAHRGKTPAMMISIDVKEKTINLYHNEYADTNFTQFCEILEKCFFISISDSTLNNWLREKNTYFPKAKRKTKKMIKKLLSLKLEETKSEKAKNIIKETISTIDSKHAHPNRSRCKYMGEMIQMDASSFMWVKDCIWHLHLAIDDATGEVVGAYFDTQETLNAYYNVTHQILTNYGIPAMFYTDRRTVFEYKRKNTAFDDEDTFTQFSYACHQLGVQIKCTSVAQAKGRVERLNQTFQSRLPVELRRALINKIDAANEFLKSYLKEFNDKFALRINFTHNVFENQPTTEKINTILAVVSSRKIDAGHSIKYKNRLYKTISSKEDEGFFKKGSTVLVIESFDQKLYANVLDQLFILEEIPIHQSMHLVTYY